MKNYKYLFERPHINNAASEKLMDFGDIYARAGRATKYRLIGNTALITFFLTVCTFSFLYLSWDQHVDNQITEPIVSEKPILPSEEKISPSSPENEKNTRSAITEPQKDEEKNGSDGTPKAAKEDSYKITESLPEKQIFVQATPVDGFQHLYKYFNLNLPFPDSLRQNNIQGKVIVEFSVTRDGEINNLKVIQKLHPVLDSIAMSSVRDMPAWQPATINNEPFETRHSIPLIFQLETK